MLALSLCYLLADVLKVWTGAPFNFTGMNSILIYSAHGVFEEYFPFGYSTESTSHEKLIMENIIGVTCWLVLGYYFYRSNFFWKL